MANAYKWRQNFIKEFEKVKKEFVRREVYGRKEQIWNAYYKHLLKIEIETGEDDGLLGRADRYNRKKKLPGILKFIANHIMSVQLGFRNRDTPGLRGRMGGLKAAAVYHGFGDWVSLFPGVQGEPFREHDKPLVAISRFGMRTWSKYDTWEEVKPVWRNTAAHELGHAKDHAFGILFDKARSRFTQITHFLNPDKAPEDFYSERAHVSKMLKRCFKVKKDAVDWHHRSVELYADLTSLRVLLQRPINKWDFILAKEAGRYGGIRQIYRGEMKTQDGEKMLKIWRMWAINTPPVAAAIREKFPTTPFVGPDAPTLHGSLRLGPAERLARRRREQSPRYQAFVKQQRKKNLEKLEGFLSKKQERHYMSTGKLPGGIICKLSPESPSCKTWQRRQSTRGGRDSRGPAGHGNPFLDPGDPRNIDPRNIDESLKENKRKKSIKDIARSLADDTSIDWLEVWYSMYDSGISDKYLDPMLASHIWEVFDYKKCRPWQGAHALERLAQVKKSRIAENFNNNKLFITNKDDSGRIKMKITKSVLKQLIKEELMTGKVNPMDLLKMLCASETIGAKILEEMMEAVLENPANLLVVLGPYREKIESVINMKLEDAINLAMSFSIELPMIGSISLKQALDMAANNPMVKSILKGMIPAALNAACQGAKRIPESKKITKSKLKELIKEELEAVREAKGKIRCPNCGHLNEGDVDECAKCGHPRGKKGPKDGKMPGKPWQKEEE